jgi:hypothetical protein
MNETQAKMLVMDVAKTMRNKDSLSPNPMGMIAPGLSGAAKAAEFLWAR